MTAGGTTREEGKGAFEKNARAELIKAGERDSCLYVSSTGC